MIRIVPLPQEEARRILLLFPFESNPGWGDFFRILIFRCV
jgi:hypothetical protein